MDCIALDVDAEESMVATSCIDNCIRLFDFSTAQRMIRLKYLTSSETANIPGRTA